MSDSSGSRDRSAGRDATNGDGGHSPDGDRCPDEAANRPIPEPVIDDASAALVRDAINVARGELSDRQFSRKYDTVTGAERNSSNSPDQ